MKKIMATMTTLLIHTCAALSDLPTPPQPPLATSSARCIGVTPDAEKMTAYIARVSNPENQENPDYAKLLKYCIRHKHWSVFEQASMTIEIETSRAIATQVLRHRSFTFQQFSQRYADNSLLSDIIPLPELRTQDLKNRQNSINNLSPEQTALWHTKIASVNAQTMALYKEMLSAGIAKESARFVLPETMPTRMYMTGDLRSWIHYIQTRTSPDTQKEHRDVALKCKEIFIKQFPIIAQALEWKSDEQAPDNEITH